MRPEIFWLYTSRVSHAEAPKEVTPEARTRDTKIADRITKPLSSLTDLPHLEMLRADGQKSVLQRLDDPAKPSLLPNFSFPSI